MSKKKKSKEEVGGGEKRKEVEGKKERKKKCPGSGTQKSMISPEARRGPGTEQMGLGVCLCLLTLFFWLVLF